MQFQHYYIPSTVVPTVHSGNFALPPTNLLLWTTHDYLDHPSSHILISHSYFIHFFTFSIRFELRLVSRQKAPLPQWLTSNLVGRLRPSFLVAFASVPAVDMTGLSTLLASGVNA